MIGSIVFNAQNAGFSRREKVTISELNERTTKAALREFAQIIALQAKPENLGKDVSGQMLPRVTVYPPLS
jgi:hypothetical protein